jgi:hypothetical protein
VAIDVRHEIVGDVTLPIAVVGDEAGGVAFEVALS